MPKDVFPWAPLHVGHECVASAEAIFACCIDVDMFATGIQGDAVRAQLLSLLSLELRPWSCK